MSFLTVAVAKPYQIHFGTDCLMEKLKAYVTAKCYHKLVILTDSTVAKLYQDDLELLLDLCIATSRALCSVATLQITIPAGELYKTRATKEDIEDQMLAFGCGRDTLLVAIGGGVVTDLGGFVAATFSRGIDVIYCPTTLLAMVDASIGGKTAVNTNHGKNLIGAFYQPLAVIADMKFLTTLSDDDYLAGLGEIIKHALLMDEALLLRIEQGLAQILHRDAQLLAAIIQRSCELKAQVVVADPEEQSVRVILNFGHTFGHALEQHSNYEIPHGLAVLLGCYLELVLAQEASDSESGLSARLYRLLKRMPVNWGEMIDGYDVNDLIKSMQYDKKTVGGEVQFVRLPVVAAYRELGELGGLGRPGERALLTSYSREVIARVYVEIASRF